QLPDASFAFGDFDGDGDLDLACYRSTQPAQLNLYRNDLPRQSWLRVRAVGLPGNRGAMGSIIRVREPGTGKLLWSEELSSTAKQVQLNSYFFAETERDFGLGDRTAADVEVQFYPSNKLVERKGVPANTTVRLAEEGDGTIVMPPEPPPPADAGGPDAATPADAGVVPTPRPDAATADAGEEPAASHPAAPGCGCHLGPCRPGGA